MLAQTFKSHEELGIDERLYHALVQVYWLLADGKIPAELFDMTEVDGPKLVKGKACGTAGCLLGWCEAIDKDCVTPNGFVLDSNARWSDFPRELSKVFLPDHYQRAFRATPKQAVAALHTYLTTGKEGWKQAFKE